MKALRLLLLGWLIPTLLCSAPVWKMEKNSFRAEKWELLPAKNESEPLKAIFLLQPTGRTGRSTITIYALPEKGDPVIVWQYTIPPDVPARITDFAITDINQDQVRELIIITDGPGTDVPWLMLFEENRASFPNQPTSQTNIQLEGNRASRPLQLYSLEKYWNQNKLLILFGGSVRKAITIAPRGRFTDNRWAAENSWFSPQFLTGASVLMAAPLFPDKLRGSHDVLMMSSVSGEPHFSLCSQNQSGQNVVKGELRGNRYKLSGNIVHFTQLKNLENLNYFIFSMDNGALAQLSTSATGELSIRSISQSPQISALSASDSSPRNRFYCVSSNGKELYESQYDDEKNSFSPPALVSKTGIIGEPLPGLHRLPDEPEALYLAVSDARQIFIERLTIDIDETAEEDLQSLLAELSAKMDNPPAGPKQDTTITDTEQEKIMLPPGFVIKDALLPALEIVDTSNAATPDRISLAEALPEAET
ncbi:MAG TPA: hypothetical protein ENN84_11965, partial [Candidatus Marinimicrobia bacterium]|nr:hypothetical protein [Candidatus Neomarinimicrobiota bacterium]